MVTTSHLLVKKAGNVYIIPISTDISHSDSQIANKFHTGSLDEYSYYTVRYTKNKAAPEGMEFMALRQLYGEITASMLKAAFRAVQIAAWDDTHRCYGGLR